jgi:rubrerythrin
MSELLNWIKKAVDLKKKGFDFYYRCNLQTKNASAQALFTFLTKQEKEHMDFLLDIQKKVESQLREEIHQAVGAYQEMHESEAIFDLKKVEKLVKQDIQLSEMLNEAINIESQSITLYTEMAAKETNKSLHTLFILLAEREKEHKDTIKKFGFRLLGMKMM